MRLPPPGFTLLEIILVLGIITILTAFTLPRYDIVQRENNLYAAARQLVVDLRYAQTLSVEGSTIITVEVQTDGYRIMDGNELVKKVSFVPGVTLENPQVLIFDALGSPSPAPLVFELKNSHGQQYYVKVEASGRVQAAGQP